MNTCLSLNFINNSTKTIENIYSYEKTILNVDILGFLVVLSLSFMA